MTKEPVAEITPVEIRYSLEVVLYNDEKILHVDLTEAQAGQCKKIWVEGIKRKLADGRIELISPLSIRSVYIIEQPPLNEGL